MKQRTAQELFYYFLLPKTENSTPERFLKHDLKFVPQLRQQVLQEIKDISLLVAGNEEEKQYLPAIMSFSRRVRALSYPSELCSRTGMEQYMNYLMNIVKLSYEELMRE